MTYGKNLYAKPELAALEVVGDADFTDVSYQFNLLVVWRDPVTGDLFYAEDSGCSCPVPFEDCTRREDLTPATKHELLRVLEARNGDGDAMDLIERVARLRRPRRR